MRHPELDLTPPHITRFARIIGTGSCLPPKRVTNNELAAQLTEKSIKISDEWITPRSGIRACHFAEPDVTCSDLVVRAVERAVEAVGIDRSELNLILVVMSTSDFVFPSTACLVQQKLDITNGCAAFNVQAVRSGFVYALATVSEFVHSGTYRSVLVIDSEVFSCIIDFTNRTIYVLFGDGAGAAVLQAPDEPGTLSTALHTNSSHANTLYVPGNVATGIVQGSAFLYMDGQAVFRLAVTMLGKATRETLAAAELDALQVDWSIPHQANIRTMQGTTKRLGLSNERLIVTIDERSNTPAALVPLAFDVAVRNDCIQRGRHVMSEGVSGGFTWDAALSHF